MRKRSPVYNVAECFRLRKNLWKVREKLKILQPQLYKSLKWPDTLMTAKHIKTILNPNYYRDNLHTKVNMMLILKYNDILQKQCLKLPNCLKKSSMNKGESYTFQLWVFKYFLLEDLEKKYIFSKLSLKQSNNLTD